MPAWPRWCGVPIKFPSDATGSFASLFDLHTLDCADHVVSVNFRQLGFTPHPCRYLGRYLVRPPIVAFAIIDQIPVFDHLCEAFVNEGFPSFFGPCANPVKAICAACSWPARLL
jgi:hypothetical protein